MTPPQLDKNIAAFLKDGFQSVLITIPIILFQVLVYGSLINFILPIMHPTEWRGSLTNGIQMSIFSLIASFLYSYIFTLFRMMFYLKDRSFQARQIAPYPEKVESDADPVTPIQELRIAFESTITVAMGVSTFAYFFPVIVPRLSISTALVMGLVASAINTFSTKLLRNFSPAHRRIALRFEQNRRRIKADTSKTEQKPYEAGRDEHIS